MSTREDGGRRGRVLYLTVLCIGLVCGSLLIHSEGPSMLASLNPSPHVIYTSASQMLDYSIHIPSTWQPGTKLGVKLPTGSILVQVPTGMKPGETFVLDVKKGKVHDTLGARQQALVQQLPKSRKALQQSFRGDLTSLDGMLKYERSLRSAMGKLKNRWPAGLKVPKADGQEAMMLAHNYIPEEEAPKAPGWDPKNPNGFGPGPSDVNNTNGVPGYTYTTNGEDLGVEDKGPGYYQPEDPEHWSSYQALLRFDCFSAAGQPWRDHANCAALVKRSHVYPNADMFRFSGAFGWNPPFPPGVAVGNKKGAMPPDSNEYWNYGSDEDFADAARWDGAKFLPPKEPPAAPEEAAADEAPPAEGAGEGEAAAPAEAAAEGAEATAEGAAAPAEAAAEGGDAGAAAAVATQAAVTSLAAIADSSPLQRASAAGAKARAEARRSRANSEEADPKSSGFSFAASNILGDFSYSASQLATVNPGDAGAGAGVARRSAGPSHLLQKFKHLVEYQDVTAPTPAKTPAF